MVFTRRKAARVASVVGSKFAVLRKSDFPRAFLRAARPQARPTVTRKRAQASGRGAAVSPLYIIRTL